MKAISINTNIHTTNGIKQAKDLTLNDSVYGADGKAYAVTSIQIQGLEDVYRVTSNTGTAYTVTSSQNIKYQTHNDKQKGKHRTETLQDILMKGLSYDTQIGKKYKVSLTLPEAVNRVEQPVSINPYTLGVMIGDGSIRHGISLTNGEKDIIQMVSEDLNDYGQNIFKVKGVEAQVISFSKSKQLIEDFEELGLYNSYSHTKFIPEVYKNNSIAVRKAVLGGLIDTDGHITHNTVMYSTTSLRLAEDVKELSESLGGTATISVSTEAGTFTQNGKEYNKRKAYTLLIRIPNLDTIVRSQKHLDKINSGYYNPKKQIRSIIKEADYLGKHQTLSFNTTNPDNTFLTDGYTVAINKTLSTAA